MSQVRVAHQFDDAEQQRTAAELGMWTFLATEILLFGGLFCAFVIYRSVHSQAFAAASPHLYMWIGAANTGVLLASSFTMALAADAAARGRSRACARLLWVTAAGGMLFLGIKTYEYSLDWSDALVPVLRFEPSHFTEVSPAHAELFFVFYWIMTGLHAVHVLVAVGLVAWTALRPANHATVENVGLYWHFVDIVWVFLFPLLYLGGGA